MTFDEHKEAIRRRMLDVLISDLAAKLAEIDSLKKELADLKAKLPDAPSA